MASPMDSVLASRKWLENLAEGRPFKLKGMGQTVEPLALSGIEVIRAERGRFLCKFVVPRHLTVSILSPITNQIAVVATLFCGNLSFLGN